MKGKVQKLHKLIASDRKLLLEIFEKTPRADTGIDALVFRAQHADSINDLERLEYWGYLRRDRSHHYIVSLSGIVQFNTRETRTLLRSAQKIFDFMREWYQLHTTEQIKLSVLAQKLKLDLSSVQNAIVYMLEGSWTSGHTTDLYSMDATVGASESIIRQYKSFQNFIDDLQYWPTQRATSDQRALPSAYDIVQASGADGAIGVATITAHPFPKAPKVVRILFDEVKRAQNEGLLALTVMGVRALIETVCNKLIGDEGSYEKKLNELVEAGYIRKRDVDILLTAVKVGNASIHRYHIPSRRSVDLCVEIAEHLLKSVYVLHPGSKVVRKKTPDRAKSK